MWISKVKYSFKHPLGGRIRDIAVTSGEESDLEFEDLI